MFDIQCQQLYPVSNAVINSTLTDALTTVRIDCYNGYRFDDGLKSRLVYCQPNGIWLNYFGPCQRCTYQRCSCKHLFLLFWLVHLKILLANITIQYINEIIAFLTK